MIGGFGEHATFSPTCKGADLDRRFGIHRDPQEGRRGGGGGIHGVQVAEDGVGCGDFFGGRVLATVRNW